MVHYSESNFAFAHPLRKGILLSIIPGYGLCIAGSVVSNSPIPGIGLIPLSMSAVLSLITLTLARKKKQGSIQLPTDDDHDEDQPAAPWLLSPLALFAYDVFFATFLMIVMVVAWTHLSWCRPCVMLTTYATVPLLFAFVAHIYLGLLALSQAFQHALKRDQSTITCPDCNTVVRTKKSSWFNSSSGRNGPYSALGDEDYRDSIDEQVSSRKTVDVPNTVEDQSANLNTQDKGKGVSEPSLSPIDE